MSMFEGLTFVGRKELEPTEHTTPKSILEDSKRYMSEVIKYVGEEEDERV